jgi:imidazole glycerol-phosphate synthase subunit HisH
MKNGRQVGVIDYRSGNIRSVLNALDAVGCSAVLVRRADELAGCTHVLLPGVGAFGFCVDRLRASGMLPALEQWALKDGRPLLGICVGMQLMADFSEEQGRHEGLRWIGGEVRQLRKDAQAGIRVPHVGWNEVRFTEAFGQFRAGDSTDFYFDHSFAYYDPARGHQVGACSHGGDFCALVRRDNIVAAQFHPEKSQEAGMRFLESFLAL